MLHSSDKKEEIEKRLDKLNDNSVTDDHWRELSLKIGDLNETARWLVRLVLGMTIAVVSAFIATGGLNTVSTLTACTVG